MFATYHPPKNCLMEVTPGVTVVGDGREPPGAQRKLLTTGRLSDLHEYPWIP